MWVPFLSRSLKANKRVFAVVLHVTDLKTAKIALSSHSLALPKSLFTITCWHNQCFFFVLQCAASTRRAARPAHCSGPFNDTCTTHASPQCELARVALRGLHTKLLHLAHVKGGSGEDASWDLAALRAKDLANLMAACL